MSTFPANKRFYAYIMTNVSWKPLYTGFTSNMVRRAAEHKDNTFDGYTGRYKIDRLVYFEVFRYSNNAINREKQLKKWSRAKKIALVKSKNPKWDDLSREWFKT